MGNNIIIIIIIILLGWTKQTNNFRNAGPSENAHKHTQCTTYIRKSIGKISSRKHEKPHKIQNTYIRWRGRGRGGCVILLHWINKIASNRLAYPQSNRQIFMIFGFDVGGFMVYSRKMCKVWCIIIRELLTHIKLTNHSHTSPTETGWISKCLCARMRR